MSTTVSVAQATRALKEFRRMLSNDQIARGASVAINKTIRETKNVSASIVSKYYHIPKKHLESIGYVISTPDTLRAHLMASRKAISMAEFDKSESKTSGITVKIKKAKPSVIKYGFTMPGRPYVYARGVYTFKKPYRFLPIKKRNKQNKPQITRMVTLSVSGALSNEKVNNEINEYVKNRLAKNVSREMSNRVSKLNNIKS